MAVLADCAASAALIVPANFTSPLTAEAVKRPASPFPTPDTSTNAPACTSISPLADCKATLPAGKATVWSLMTKLVPLTSILAPFSNDTLSVAKAPVALTVTWPPLTTIAAACLSVALVASVVPPANNT